MRTDLFPSSNSSSSSLLGAEGKGIVRGGVGGDGDSRKDLVRDKRGGRLEEVGGGGGGEEDDDDEEGSAIEVPSMLSCSRIRRWADAMLLSNIWSRVEYGGTSRRRSTTS